MSAALTFRWNDGALRQREDCDVLPASIEAADSWLVSDGAARALDLHRSRFFEALGRTSHRIADLDAFWDAAIAAIPRSGDWFPRVEVRLQSGRPEALVRIRPAPALARSIVLATHTGRDPRTAPRTKGPDLEAMVRLRTSVQQLGAGDAVVLTPEGWIADGSTTCLAWWRGDALAIPHGEIARIDSVTLRSLQAVATAMGIDILHENARPEDVEGCEVWALNALHGIRIVTRWHDGPAVAEEPGRVESWRRRLDVLRKPLPTGGGA